MSLWEGSFQNVDSSSFNAMLQMQLEDTQELASCSKGKQREGTLTGAELALQLYLEDLQACNNIMTDRKMAQSMAIAVIHDAQILHRERPQAEQVARDHELALALQNDTGNGAAAGSQQADI